MTDLVYATLTGRNFGWLPTEQHAGRPPDRHSHPRGQRHQRPGPAVQRLPALRHSVQTAATADPRRIPAAAAVLPEPWPRPPTHKSHEDVSNLIASYVNSLAFSRDDNNKFNGSPYDQFLIVNNLPRAPAAGQSPATVRRCAAAAAAEPERSCNSWTTAYLHSSTTSPSCSGPRNCTAWSSSCHTPAGPVITGPAEAARRHRQLRRLPHAAGLHRSPDA